MTQKERQKAKRESQKDKQAKEDNMTKALAIVMAIKDTTQIFVECLVDSGEMKGRLRQQVKKIDGWAEACVKCIRDEVPLTNARERAYMRKIDTMNHSRKVIVGSCADSTFNWTAWIYALDVLLWDAKAMLKPMTKKSCWRYLCMVWGTLMEWMLYTVKDERMQGPYVGYDAEAMGMILYNHMQQNFQFIGGGS
ncbi:MAG: hypothetical protein R3Y11_00375 [Pseudomonadota bacterium]